MKRISLGFALWGLLAVAPCACWMEITHPIEEYVRVKSMPLLLPNRAADCGPIFMIYTNVNSMPTWEELSPAPRKMCADFITVNPKYEL